MSRVRGVTAARIASGSGATTTTSAPETASGPEEAEVLVRRRHDLVAGPEPEAADGDPAALGRRARERDLRRLGAHERRKRATQLLAKAHRRLEVRQPASTLHEVALDPVGEGLGDRPRERAERAGVEEGDRLEDRKERPGLGERHDAFSETTRSSIGAWSESTAPFCWRLARDQVSGGVARAPRTRMWSIPSAGSL